MTIAAHPMGIGRHFRAASCCGLVLLLLASSANALFIVNLPWVRPAARGQSTEAYMNLTSTDDATLVAVRTDVAAGVAIAGPGADGPPARSLPLPAGAAVALAPGKVRLAITRLARGLKPGDTVTLTLTVVGADGTRRDIPVQAEVRTRSPLDDEKHAHHAH